MQTDEDFLIENILKSNIGFAVLPLTCSFTNFCLLIVQFFQYLLNDFHKNTKKNSEAFILSSGNFKQHKYTQVCKIKYLDYQIHFYNLRVKASGTVYIRLMADHN